MYVYIERNIFIFNENEYKNIFKDMKQYLNRSEIGESRKLYLDRVNSFISSSGNEIDLFLAFALKGA